MYAEPDIPWTRVAAFVRQHTHDVRNGLNSLDLETALLQELISDEEAQSSVARVRKQLRSLAEQLRSLSSLLQDPHPMAAPIAARELFLIWKEKHAGLRDAPTIHWVDELGDEKVNVDVEMMAAVFRELLVNAAAFSQGETITATARVKGGDVIFELAESKKSAVDTSTWGTPFSTTRQGGYGLGLWAAQRQMEANGATLSRRYVPEDGKLTTQIVLAVA